MSISDFSSNCVGDRRDAGPATDKEREPPARGGFFAPLIRSTMNQAYIFEWQPNKGFSPNKIEKTHPHTYHCTVLGDLNRL